MAWASSVPTPPPLLTVVHVPNTRLLQLLTVLTLLVMQVTCHGCKVEHCTRAYQQNKEANLIRSGPNLGYCLLLRQYSDCIRASARACRGNLKYHSTLSHVQRRNSNYNCSHIIAQPNPVHPAPQPRPTPAANHACSYRGPRQFRHCGLFGDPHLMTFNNEYQTCKVKGAWPLIDNAYIAVQVTNEAVAEGREATATSKVTVIIKGSTPCAGEKTYEAQVDSLPSAFIDGTQIAGTERSVQIKVKEPGKLVEISIRYIETIVMIRKVGKFLAFQVRMPKEIADQGLTREGLQLCVKGCPYYERIDYKHFLGSGLTLKGSHNKGHSGSTMNMEMALGRCREYNVTDHFFDWCVFDLMTTGDPTFSAAARNAQVDVLQLYPESVNTMKNRTSPPFDVLTSPTSTSKAHSDQHAPGRPLGALIIVFFLLVFTNR